MLALLKVDARRIPLADESVQCVVTSPPYWGLRKYAGEQELVWNGQEDCEHGWGGKLISKQNDSNRGSMVWTTGGDPGAKVLGQKVSQGQFCHCGAWRGAYGLEPTVEMYVQHTVEILREIRRVLRDDGVCFLNLGDSYATQPAGNKKRSGFSQTRPSRQGPLEEYNTQISWHASGLKPKDLCLIPFRVALAAQTDGWWVRSDIIWAKPNPMPESVTDRPTRSHEYILLLVKGEWKSRVVKFSDLPSEKVHFGKHMGLQESGMRTPSTKFCVSLASALFNGIQCQHNFSLPPFYSQEWEKEFQTGDSCSVGCFPISHRAAMLAARFLCSGTTTKEFIGQLHGLLVALPNYNESLMGTAPGAVFALPFVDCNRDGTVTINDSGEICEFDFAHEEIVHKTPRICNYYWDAEAVAEPASENKPWNEASSWRGDKQVFLGQHEAGNLGKAANGKRNLRSVWTFSTEPYPEAHFATFPEELPKRCILAATSAKGACVQCGTPWERVVDKTRTFESGSGRSGNLPSGKNGPNLQGGGETVDIRRGPVVHCETVGWHPGCECGIDETVPCLVLDPFAGSGTVGKVAIELGRRAILCDLAYQDLASKRTAAIQRPLLEASL